MAGGRASLPEEWGIGQRGTRQLISPPLRTGAFAVLLAGSCARAPETPPDIILVVVDTLRRDHVGTYG